MKPIERKLGEKNHKRAAERRPPEDRDDQIRAGKLPEVEGPDSEEDIVADPEGAREHGQTPAA
jgi:hypothetical protein